MHLQTHHFIIANIVLALIQLLLYKGDSIVSYLPSTVTSLFEVEPNVLSAAKAKAKMTALKVGDAFPEGVSFL